ncbi:MAG: right-handed parallel beta-helix repeat-containing protein [Candidatus Binatia bacterium]
MGSPVFPRLGFTASSVRVALALVAFGCGQPVRASTGDCGERPVVTSVIAATFQNDGHVVAGTCDLNSDEVVTAADVTGLVALPAPPACSVGKDLVVEIDNQTGRSPVSIVLSGERLGAECVAGSLATSYRVAVDCSGTGLVTCGQISALAPGSWRHSILMVLPDTGQNQHQVSLLVGGGAPNAIYFTAFASVLSVRTSANQGNDSLRNVLQSVDAVRKPALIQFSPDAFPPGVPVAIRLDLSLPALAADDVTIDGIDVTGAVGNRIIDANGLPIGAFGIGGARNHIIGLHLRNSGGNDRDLLSITGPRADGNVVERTIIEGPSSADGIGVRRGAGKDFGNSANVIRDCEISGVSDKGVKVTTGAHARVERCWVHDNANGGIQATLGGHVQAWHNLVERNRGSTAQNGLSANAQDTSPGSSAPSELETWGDISRGNGANGVAVRDAAVGRLHDDYLAANGSDGLRIYNDTGPPSSASVEGTSAVCNAVDGAGVANLSSADFGGGALGSPGNNAFAQNNLPAGGSNLRNSTGIDVSAANNQWEHCGHGAICDDGAIITYDVGDHGVHTTIVPTQAHRSQQPPVVSGTEPTTGRRGGLLRIFGSGFNVIDGLFAEDKCTDVRGRNRCVPLRGNCVQIDGVAAPVEAVTPTMLVVRWPFTCVQPAPLVVTTAFGGTSTPMMVCVNGPPAGP